MTMIQSRFIRRKNRTHWQTSGFPIATFPAFAFGIVLAACSNRCEFIIELASTKGRFKFVNVSSCLLRFYQQRFCCHQRGNQEQ